MLLSGLLVFGNRAGGSYNWRRPLNVRSSSAVRGCRASNSSGFTDHASLKIAVGACNEKQLA